MYHIYIIYTCDMDIEQYNLVSKDSLIIHQLNLELDLSSNARSFAHGQLTGINR